LGAAVSYPTTDQGNGEYFADLYGHAAKYDYLQHRWLVWTDHYWAPDTANVVSQLATAVARQRRTDAAALDDPVRAKHAFAWAYKSESSAGLANALIRAEAQPGCQQFTWDTDPYSLGVPEGVVDTRTGILRPGVPTDDVTFQTGVSYDPAATCPVWDSFFAEIFNHDAELMHYVHKAVGYSLTADTSEQVFFLCHGKGSNGKGTFTRALRHVLGDYAHTLSFSLFEAKNTAQYDLASLPGKRLVTLAEVPDAGYTLNSALIKTLTGQDTIRVANKHQRAFDCTPVAKYWMEVNHLPRIADDGHALWRRLRYIPFLQTFTPDLTLPARLEREAAGILAWAVRGAVLWHTERLTHVPAVMTLAAADYRADSDVLGDFLAACVMENPTARCPFATLYAAYLQWSEQDRSKPMSKQLFGRIWLFS
jgi:putative DNA primase/helicase